MWEERAMPSARPAEFQFGEIRGSQTRYATRNPDRRAISGPANSIPRQRFLTRLRRSDNPSSPTFRPESIPDLKSPRRSFQYFPTGPKETLSPLPLRVPSFLFPEFIGVYRPFLSRKTCQNATNSLSKRLSPR